MIYPNKNIKLQDSIIFKMIKLLQNNDSRIDIHNLYSNTIKDFNSIDEFILSLDVLYILDIIEIDFPTETITYVNRNTV
ncbi:ABC-three component system middle component 7 [Flavobacterium coralii]|uniref:ABC-three component system middle component 7 n=1 Tax=Flavobacterium coralii TaxID=2838017 RepID=UPI0034DB7B2F